MRTILSLALALVFSAGALTLTGCDKKAGTKTETKTESKGPDGSTTTTDEMKKTETTAPTDHK